MKIALVGNQNCGKSTLFNSLTGLNQKVGNWPGVTVERKSGIIKGSDHELIDLPGIYSLFPYSEEEKVSRDFLLSDNVDLIINVVDSTSIERSLYLTIQLKELDIPIILVLNMTDLASKKGIVINKENLKKDLDVNVVEVSALRNIGVNELLEEINKDLKINKLKVFDSYLQEKILNISKNIKMKHSMFYSIKALEEDDVSGEYIDKVKSEIKLIKEKYDRELIEVIVSERYEFIEKVRNNCVERIQNKVSINDRLDNLFLNKWLALPIFALVMFLVYYLSVGVVGSYTSSVVESIICFVKEKSVVSLNYIGVSKWLVSLIVNGIISGVGSVLNFIPQLMMLFLCISLLESSGYMSRISFFLDAIFKRFGMSGKTLVPFIVGSGCSVPGVMSTRIIENKKEREMAIVLTPFIPCSAKLPIIALFGNFFFAKKSGFFCFSLYLMSIFIVLLTASIFKKFIYKDESNFFISELPEYKIPVLKFVVNDVVGKVISFVKRAGSLIFLSSIVIWFLLSFSFELEYVTNVESSILAVIGKTFSFVFYPILGEFSWGATVSSIQGLIAKEQVVSSLSIISNMSDSVSIFNGGKFGFFSSSTAYAYVVFNLFSAPCFGTVSVIKKELGSCKKMILVVIFEISVAWILAVLLRLLIIMIGG